MMVLEVDDKPFKHFTSMDVTRSIKALAGSFKFDATSSIETLFPIHTGQKARVMINGTPIVTGYVELVEVSYAADSHSISVSGRDITGDCIDSSIKIKKFQFATDLKTVAEKLVKAAGIKVGVKSDVGALAFNGADVEEASVGTSIHAFLEPYCRKLGVLQTTDGQGNIVFVRTGEGQASCALVQQRGNPNNNVLGATVKRDDTGRFGQYLVQDQKNMSGAEAEGEAAEAVANQSGSYDDTTMRPGRMLELSMESAGSAEDADRRAKFEANIRNARSLTYDATVQGFYQDAARTRLWQPNEQVMVSDDYLNLHQQMLINEVSFSLSESGSVTSLQCVHPKSYSEEPVPQPQAAPQEGAE